jgi:2-dehydropantoate 2-reductase
VKIAVVGAGAMGSVFGARLAAAGEDVTLIDVWREGIEAVNAGGLRVDDRSGSSETIPVRATTEPETVGVVDLVLVFVKCYHTEAAVRAAAPLIGSATTVLSLQNGWGNAPRIAAVVGEERILVGVTYHSATMAGAGHVQHTGYGMTFIGELNGGITDRVRQIARAFEGAGLEVTPTAHVLKEIWSKLALNVCTLPASALLRFTADQMVRHDGTLSLMQALLGEAVAVANAKGISLDFEERWQTITGLLARAVGGKGSMLQDVEKQRRTEIDVINGAIVAAGREQQIPTPHNETMVWLIRSLEETFEPPRGT